MTIERWFCPLYQSDIAEGKCLDLNYERLGYLSAGCLDELRRQTGKVEPEVSATCERCPNLPVREDDFNRARFPKA
jgi:hypothetical protein